MHIVHDMHADAGERNTEGPGSIDVQQGHRGGGTVSGGVVVSNSQVTWRRPGRESVDVTRMIQIEAESKMLHRSHSKTSHVSRTVRLNCDCMNMCLHSAHF